MSLYLLFGIIFIFTYTAAAQNATSDFTHIVAFGDSYTTDKNDVCNGPKWIRQLSWPSLSIRNYAVGGAYCTDTKNTSNASVSKQVQEFLASNGTSSSSSDDGTLYSILIGINDMAGNKSVDNVLQCINDQVNKLYQGAGAKHFMLFNMVPFDMSPSVAHDGIVEKSSAWIQTFNKQMPATVSTLSQSGLAIKWVDIHSTVSDVYEHQADYGITKDPNTYYTFTNDPETDPNKLENGNTYFWYNDAHVTSVVHTQIAKAVDEQYHKSPTTTSGVRPSHTTTPHSFYLTLTTLIFILF